jgi:hypothetical protein
MLRQAIGRRIAGKGYAAVLEYGLDTAYGLAHPELLRGGATPGEEVRPLAGDDLVPEPIWEATRAETVHAAPRDVWPWLVQMGYGRGGWYAFAPFDPRGENTIDVIEPNLQRLKVGDVWLDGSGCDEHKGVWTVASIEPRRALVVRSLRDPFTGVELEPADRGDRWLDCSWAFALEPTGADTTRLLARTRATFAPAWLGIPLRYVFGAGDTVWHRTMLRGIRERAELTAASRPARRSAGAAARPAAASSAAA